MMVRVTVRWRGFANSNALANIRSDGSNRGRQRSGGTRTVRWSNTWKVDRRGRCGQQPDEEDDMVNGEGSGEKWQGKRLTKGRKWVSWGWNVATEGAMMEGDGVGTDEMQQWRKGLGGQRGLRAYHRVSGTMSCLNGP
eukprot:Gb_05950 [translate_table: standard]